MLRAGAVLLSAAQQLGDVLSWKPQREGALGLQPLPRLDRARQILNRKLDMENKEC